MRFACAVFALIASSCSGSRSGAAPAPAPALADSVGRAAPPASQSFEVSEARYGDIFPRAEHRHPALAGMVDPRSLHLVVEVWGSASSLPWVKRLAADHPGLEVVVCEGSMEQRTRDWVVRSGLPFIADDDYDSRWLDGLSRDPRFGNHLANVTSPMPSMAVADGVARDSHEAGLFHGPWLVWAGAPADAKHPIEQAARGAWSRQALDAFEGIRSDVNAQAKVVMELRHDDARAMAKRILERPDAQPSRLVDMSLGMVFTLQERGDISLIHAFADRAVVETAGLDFRVLRDAGFAHHMTGDQAGALRHGKRALELCQEVQDDCGAAQGNLADWERCPIELFPVDPKLAVEMQRSGVGWLPRFTTAPRKGTPADCKKF